MVAILQIFWNASSWMKMYELQLKFQLNLCIGIQAILFHHWFRYWLGAWSAPSHYLKQWWVIYWSIYASLGINELKHKFVCYVGILQYRSFISISISTCTLHPVIILLILANWGQNISDTGPSLSPCSYRTSSVYSLYRLQGQLCIFPVCVAYWNIIFILSCMYFSLLCICKTCNPYNITSWTTCMCMYNNVFSSSAK